MDPDALWRDLKDEMKELAKDPDNRDLRLHVCSPLEALARWIRMNGFSPTIQEAVCPANS
jgi:hypothetical protein